MLSYFESKTLNGTITVETEEGVNEQVVSLYGMKSETGEMNFNNNVINKALYDANKESIKKEIEDFIELIKVLEV